MQWHEIFWLLAGLAAAYVIGYGLMLYAAWARRRREEAARRWERLQFNATRRTVHRG